MVTTTPASRPLVAACAAPPGRVAANRPATSRDGVSGGRGRSGVAYDRGLGAHGSFRIPASREPLAKKSAPGQRRVSCDTLGASPLPDERCVVLCPTCAKVNDASALACSLCGAAFGAEGRTQARPPAADKTDRRRTAPGMRTSPAAATLPIPGPAAPAAAAVGHKVPTLRGVRAPALEARGTNKTRTTIGVAMPGPGNERPAPAPSAPAPGAPTPAARTLDALPPSPRQVLCELLRRHGEEVMTDPRRCGSLLAADYHRHVSYLVVALEERIPQRLVVASSEAPIEVVVLALANELGRKRELPAPSALYAVESWAIALGLLVAPPGA